MYKQFYLASLNLPVQYWYCCDHFLMDLVHFLPILKKNSRFNFFREINCENNFTYIPYLNLPVQYWYLCDHQELIWSLLYKLSTFILSKIQMFFFNIVSINWPETEDSPIRKEMSWSDIVSIYWAETESQKHWRILSKTKSWENLLSMNWF